jgi:hypothetical protein
MTSEEHVNISTIRGVMTKGGTKHLVNKINLDQKKVEKLAREIGMNAQLVRDKISSVLAQQLSGSSEV